MKRGEEETKETPGEENGDTAQSRGDQEEGKTSDSGEEQGTVSNSDTEEHAVEPTQQQCSDTPRAEQKRGDSEEGDVRIQEAGEREQRATETEREQTSRELETEEATGEVEKEHPLGGEEKGGRTHKEMDRGQDRGEVEKDSSLQSSGAVTERTAAERVRENNEEMNKEKEEGSLSTDGLIKRPRRRRKHFK